MWAVSVGPALVVRAQGQVWRKVAIGCTAAKPLPVVTGAGSKSVCVGRFGHSERKAS